MKYIIMMLTRFKNSLYSRVHYNFCFVRLIIIHKIVKFVKQDETETDYRCNSVFFLNYENIFIKKANKSKHKFLVIKSKIPKNGWICIETFNGRIQA